MQQLKIMDHPLISHKMAILRHKDTDGKAFRELVSEIAMLICYEATRDMICLLYTSVLSERGGKRGELGFRFCGAAARRSAGVEIVAVCKPAV